MCYFERHSMFLWKLLMEGSPTRDAEEAALQSSLRPETSNFEFVYSSIAGNCLILLLYVRQPVDHGDVLVFDRA
ncbi:hypothetical protein Y032_0080g1368 [Ancylostoma ceylanicum]|uniref:Uncharacterized protein n=1 Tax=Ancylostoma ceylanicum TaxID=53326 RepID=A0A016TSN6_9BILA|nr:hypothetical protein Y032_0080g1368 [Ancylostoma ceylanicum]